MRLGTKPFVSVLDALREWPGRDTCDCARLDCEFVRECPPCERCEDETEVERMMMLLSFLSVCSVFGYRGPSVSLPSVSPRPSVSLPVTVLR